MKYNAGEIAGFIGAAAWIPHVVSVLRKYFTVPKVLFVPDKDVEVGFTTLGPIFNLKLAVSVDKEDVVLTDFGVKLQHEDGEVRHFTWRGAIERFSEIRDQSGTTQFVEKDQSPIAMKVKTSELPERFFRFQEDKFHQKVAPVLQEATNYQDFLRSQWPDYQDELMQSEKIHALITSFREGFWWKAGRYTVSFHAKSPKHRIEIEVKEFAFGLKQQQVEDLRNNLQALNDEVEWIVKNGTPGFQKQRPHMAWVYSTLVDIS